MVELPSAFLQRMKRSLGSEFDKFLESYSKPVARGVRVNTLKISVDAFKDVCPLPLDGKVPWEPRAFYVDKDGLGKTIAHEAGLYYVQEPSAMCSAPRVEANPGERVLDLCSAPGGKGTQLAQDMCGEGVLVLNEIVQKRAEILRSNVERLGVTNAVVTCADPETLAKIFKNYFDKILVDAPCSGEGMFKKEEAAIPEWSEQNVRLCAERQSRILDCADKMLAAGGRLVYSTCTFAEAEDEEQVENFLKTHKNYSLKYKEKLMPHKVRGEGHFCAVLEKLEGERYNIGCVVPKIQNKPLLNAYREWEQATLNVRLERLLQVNSSLYYIAEDTPDLTGLGLKYNSGVYIGTLAKDGKRFEPSHAFAMCLSADKVRCVEVDEQTALKYLQGLTFCCGLPSGWYAVAYRGYPLGWCKVANETAKNHYPKSLRTRK